jgi:hypothetical protein
LFKDKRHIDGEKKKEEKSFFRLTFSTNRNTN